MGSASILLFFRGCICAGLVKLLNNNYERSSRFTYILRRPSASWNFQNSSSPKRSSEGLRDSNQIWKRWKVFGRQSLLARWKSLLQALTTLRVLCTCLRERSPFEEVQKKVDLSNRMAQLSGELAKLSWEERYEWVNIMKLKGNRLYAQMKFEEAVLVYMDALIGLDFSDQTRLHVVKEELQYPLLVNMSTCYYKLEQWQKGIALCDKVLEERPNHTKALFKKGGLMAKMGRFDQAKSLFDAALRENPPADLRPAIMQERQQLSEKLKAQQTVYKLMFDQETGEENKALLNGSSTVAGDEDVLVYQEPSLFARMLNCLKSLVRRNRRRSTLHND